MAYRRAVSDTDPARFATHFAAPRGFRQAYVHEGAGGVPVVCVHGWPETKRIFWRVIEPLADAGFEVIVPDLRGFGESERRPGRLPRRARAQPRPLRARPRPPRARAGRAGRRRPRRAGHPGPRPAPPGVGRADGAVQLAAALRQGADGRAADPPGPRGQRLLRPPGHRPRRRWPPSSTPRSSAVATSPPSTRSGSGRTPARSSIRRAAGSLRRQRGRRLPHRAVRRRRPSCGRSFGGYESVFDPAARSEPPLLDPQRPHADARPLRPVGPRALPRLRPHGGRRLRPITSGPFLLRDCGHFVPWEAPHALVSGTQMMAADLLAARRSSPVSRG